MSAAPGGPEPFLTEPTRVHPPVDDLRPLVADGTITAEQLERAERLALRRRSSPASVLLGERLITEYQLATARGSVWGIPAIDLSRAEFDPALVRQRAAAGYRERGWIPVRRLEDGSIRVATFVPPDERLRREVETELGAHASFVATDRWSLRQATLAIFADEVADEAANGLGRREPLLSARTTLSRGQAVGFIAAAVVAIAALVIWPVITLATGFALISLAFLLANVFKFVVAQRGARYDLVEQIGDAEVAALSDDELPVFTVLVPVFREANIVGQLIDNLGALDYPRHRLEVLILVEEEDDETRDAIALSDPPVNFRVLTVPVGAPQTKPRACNVGLQLCTGEFLVIYDAEDRPEPDQLKKAVIAFRDGGDDLACVQAALGYFNAQENALTRMFTLEYGFWFLYMLPGLDSLGLPIPLGGTSNHFRVAQLRELGGWDPYNVTEDADLGIRASALGYRVGVINSTTLEEANTSIPNFIRQRSRWIKGYMQTTLVHARQPRALIRKVGIVGFASFALLIAGTPLSFLGVIPAFVTMGAAVAARNEDLSGLAPVWVLWVMLVNYLIGTVIAVYLNMLGPFKHGHYALVPWALLNPVYWVLHSIAAYKALWQLATRPHYWEKTEHGLTTQPTDAAADALVGGGAP